MRQSRFQSPIEIQGRERVIQGTIPRMQPDVRQQAELRSLHTLPLPPNRMFGQCPPRRRVTASNIGMADWNGTLTVTSNSLPIHSNGNVLYSKLAIPQNKYRKKFLIINPDTNLVSIYFSYKYAPLSVVPLIPGALWLEQGPDVSRDDIYLWCTITTNYGAYEGLYDQVDE